jgi:hypothetical protein
MKAITKPSAYANGGSAFSNFTKMEKILCILWILSFVAFLGALGVVKHHFIYSIITGIISAVCYTLFLHSLMQSIRQDQSKA